MVVSTALTRGSILTGYIALTQRHGGDAFGLLEASGISALHLEQPDLYFPFAQYASLLEGTAEELKHPLFGLELGIEQGLDLFGPTAFLLTTSETLRAALKDMVGFFGLQSSGSSIDLAQSGRTAILTYQAIDSGAPAIRQVNEHAIGAALAIFRTLLGSGYSPLHFYLPHDSRGLELGYRRFLGTEPIFNSEMTAVSIKPQDLERSLSDANPELHRLIEKQLLSEKEATGDRGIEHYISLRVKHAMTSSGELSIEQVTRTTSLSKRTLQRRLSEQGVTFQQLVDKARCETAEYYLAMTDLSLTQIAGLLAFASLSNFSHAFRRWHDTSPTQWRGLNREERTGKKPTK